MKKTHFYVGTYTQTLEHVDGQADGIYTCQLTEDGTLTIIHTNSGIENPSYLTLSANKKNLYAVQEGATLADSAVFAYALDAKTGELTFLNQQPTQGSSPCHLCVDASNSFLFVANYGGGNVIVYLLAENGRIQSPSQNLQHEGKGTNPKRQEAPHAHMVLLSPDDQYLLVADLGLDAIVVYKFETTTGNCQLLSQTTAVNAGAGPRHLVFHPNGRILFACNELDNTISSFRFNEGQLIPLQTLSTLPPAWSGNAGCGAIRVAENGRFVYVSNRGPDNIATFNFDAQTEQLTLTAHTPTQGQFPRDFILIDNTLLAANQNSSNVAHFQIDSETGIPQFNDQISSIPTPVCLAQDIL